MDIIILSQSIFNFALVASQIIGGATILLHMIAPLTKWKGDDRFLSALETILKKVSLNKEDNSVKIKLK